MAPNMTKDDVVRKIKRRTSEETTVQEQADGFAHLVQSPIPNPQSLIPNP